MTLALCNKRKTGSKDITWMNKDGNGISYHEVFVETFLAEQITDGGADMKSFVPNSVLPHIFLTFKITTASTLKVYMGRRCMSQTESSSNASILNLLLESQRKEVQSGQKKKIIQGSREPTISLQYKKKDGRYIGKLQRLREQTM